VDWIFRPHVYTVNKCRDGFFLHGTPQVLKKDYIRCRQLVKAIFCATVCAFSVVYRRTAVLHLFSFSDLIPMYFCLESLEGQQQNVSPFGDYVFW
jgi:hypothetical protein